MLQENKRNAKWGMELNGTKLKLNGTKLQLNGIKWN
jgi:hypothetical protein